MNNTPKPTPRTDELGHKCAETAYNPQGDCDLLWPFTRQLERELTAVTEQRDRLAEVLNLFLNRVQYTSAYMDGELRGGTFDYRSSGFDAEVKQAYQTIASIKGGSDES